MDFLVKWISICIYMKKNTFLVTSNVKKHRMFSLLDKVLGLKKPWPEV